jgi:hypothetical protein
MSSSINRAENVLLIDSNDSLASGNKKRTVRQSAGN